MRLLSLAHRTIADATPLELVAAASAAGFRAIAPRLTGFTPLAPGPTIVHDRDEAREFRRRLDDAGIRVTSICAYRLMPEVQVADFDPVFETCARRHRRADHPDHLLHS